MAEPQKPAEQPKPAEPQKPAAKTQVVALARGYYGGQLRELGDKFEIEKDTDLGGWMDPIGEGAKRLAAQVAAATKNKTRPAPINANIRQTPAMRLK